jgi:hypothetical protein
MPRGYRIWKRQTAFSSRLLQAPSVTRPSGRRVFAVVGPAALLVLVPVLATALATAPGVGLFLPIVVDHPRILATERASRLCFSALVPCSINGPRFGPMSSGRKSVVQMN